MLFVLARLRFTSQTLNLINRMDDAIVRLYLTAKLDASLSVLFSKKVKLAYNSDVALKVRPLSSERRVYFNFPYVLKTTTENILLFFNIITAQSIRTLSDMKHSSLVLSSFLSSLAFILCNFVHYAGHQ